MNPRDRRKLTRPDAPAAKTRATSDLLDVIVAFRAAQRTAPYHYPPRFRMPPKEVTVVVPLHQIGERIALNESAKDLVHMIRVKLGDTPTLLMFDVALEVSGVAVDRVSLEELGIHMPGEGTA